MFSHPTHRAQRSHHLGVLVAAALVPSLCAMPLYADGTEQRPAAVAEGAVTAVTILRGSGPEAVFELVAGDEDVVAIVVRGEKPDVELIHVIADGAPADLVARLAGHRPTAQVHLGSEFLDGASVAVPLGEPAPVGYVVEFVRRHGDPVELQLVPGDAPRMTTSIGRSGPDD